MLSYSRSHLADHVLLRTLAAVVTQDRVTAAELLALIAEVDRRGLFRSEGYPSMFRYCVGRLGMSEDMAYKRIQAARKAREIPAIFSAIADGRLHLTAVVLLRPYLTPTNGAELLAEASGKSKAEVELLIAGRFPREDVPTTLTPIPSVVPVQVAETFGGESPAPAAPAEPPQGRLANVVEQLVPEPVAPEKGVPIAVFMVPPTPQRRVAPLSPGRFELKLTISQELHDKLKRAEELLGHAVPSGDIPRLLERLKRNARLERDSWRGSARVATDVRGHLATKASSRQPPILQLVFVQPHQVPDLVLHGDADLAGHFVGISACPQ